MHAVDGAKEVRPPAAPVRASTAASVCPPKYATPVMNSRPSPSVTGFRVVAPNGLRAHSESKATGFAVTGT